jgi:ribosomal protein L16 Arg81 hydroxylase
MHRLSNGRKPTLATLADLLAPVSTSDFLKQFRAKKRLHIPASDHARAETLFSWQDIDTLLSEHMLDEDVEILRDSVKVPRQFYTSNEGKRLNLRAFHNLLPQGVSIVVNFVQRSIPKIRQLSVAIERELGITTNVNAYLSFFKGGAFKPHSDNMDVLVLQVHGNKQWRIWNTELPYPVESQLKVNASETPDQEVEMAPGDVLFIPRGEPHSAAVSSKHSVHLTIGLESQTGLNFIDHLRNEARKDLVFRMDLPRHSSDEDSRAHEAALKRQLHHLIDAASMSQFLQESDRSQSPALQTTVLGELPRSEDILRLTLRRRVPLPDVPPDSEPQLVMIGGETPRLSPASIDALRWLFNHDPTNLRALHSALTPRHGHDSTQAAIRELLQLGFFFVNRAD